MAHGADIGDLAVQLAIRAGHDPHTMVVRGQVACGFSPDGIFHFVPPETLIPLWTLYLRMAADVRREAIALADAA